jgi:hypothetical protein
MLLSTYAGCDAETVAMFQQADLEEEMTATTTISTAFFPPGFEEAMDRIAARVVADRSPCKGRVTLLASVRAGFIAGEIRPLVFMSDANPTYNRHAHILYTAGLAGARDALASYPLSGSNAYAKALIGYRDLLVQFLDAKATKQEAA